MENAHHDQAEQFSCPVPRRYCLREKMERVRGNFAQLHICEIRNNDISNCYKRNAFFAFVSMHFALAAKSEFAKWKGPFRHPLLRLKAGLFEGRPFFLREIALAGPVARADHKGYRGEAPPVKVRHARRDTAEDRAPERGSSPPLFYCPAFIAPRFCDAVRCGTEHSPALPARLSS